MKLLLNIRFVGTNYKGYQLQKNGITVQKCMTDAAKSVFDMPCDIVGCSRTDSGVHAVNFALTVSEHGKNCLSTSIPVERIPQAFNFYLPADIRVFRAQWVGEDFHARYGVKSKTYLYKLDVSSFRDPFEEGRSFHPDFPITEQDVLAMNTGAGYFVGEHDFASFMASGSKIKDTVRTIYGCTVKKENDTVTFQMTGNGFLYHMVRIMVGTLLLIPQKKIVPADIETIIHAKDRKAAGATAPACGLYLYDVEYGDYTQE